MEDKCDFDVMIGHAACARCASRKELYALIVMILADEIGYNLPDDLNQLLEDTACFRCPSDREKLQLIAGALFDKYWDGTVDELLSEIRCLLCVDENQLKAILVLLFCRYIDNCNGGPR